MAAILTQRGFDPCTEFGQQVERHIGLQRSGKAAAVHAACAASVQQPVCASAKASAWWRVAPVGVTFCRYSHDEIPEALTSCRKSSKRFSCRAAI